MEYAKLSKNRQAFEETFKMNWYSLICGDSKEAVLKLDDNSIDCIVTSPPYFNLRDYNTGYWEGGDEACDHSRKRARNDHGRSNINNFHGSVAVDSDKGSILYKDQCRKCGAKRIDRQIGLEETVKEYIEKLASVFGEAKRVLKSNGVVFLNIGDTWATKAGAGYKKKDLLMVPFHLAIALQRDGWYVRQAIIWHATNKMPESATDRCTNAHEYVFLLSKSPSYYFDYAAIQEPAAYDGRKKTTLNAGGKYAKPMLPGVNPPSINKNGGERWRFENGVAIRRARSVWSIPTKAYRGAHYAPMPVALAEKCIIAGCPVDGVVLDPFCGVSTTIVAALKNQRNAIGIDLSANFIELSHKRISDEIGFSTRKDLTSEEERDII